MDLLIGIFIGVTLAATSTVIYRKVKRTQLPKKPKVDPHTLYTELSSLLVYKNGSSIKELREFLEEIEKQKANLLPDDYLYLRKDANQRIESIEREARTKEEAQPKLARFRELRKRETDSKSLYKELHKINVTGDGIITYDELSTYGTKEELRWMTTTHESLLEERLHVLLARARGGDVAAFASCLITVESLVDFYSEEGETAETFVTRIVGHEWNEALIRVRPDCTLDEIRGFADLTDDAFVELIRRARVDKDPLSIKLVILSADEFEENVTVLGHELLKDLRADFDQFSSRLVTQTPT